MVKINLILNIQIFMLVTKNVEISEVDENNS